MNINVLEGHASTIVMVKGGKGVNVVVYTGRLQGRSLGSRKKREPSLGNWEQCTGKMRM